MIILHCLKKSEWEQSKSLPFYGDEYIDADGFIHCSDIHTFKNVAPNFKNSADELLLLCIDTDKINAHVKWEDGDNCGTEYPHIYGLLNTDAVIKALPFLTDMHGDFVLNDDLQSLNDA